MSKAEPLLFDGASGTLFARRTGKPAAEVDLAAVTEPQTVVQIHRDYIDAGARAIKTCTFSLPQSAAGRLEEVSDQIHAAISCAKEAVDGRDVLIFADLGPVAANEDPGTIYPALARLFEREGIDHFLFETLADTTGLARAFRSIKDDHPEAFILCSFAAGSDGLTASGQSAARLLEQMDQEESVDAIGLNCHCGPTHMFSLVREVPAFSSPLSVMPNAGYPSITARAALYDGQPDYFARHMEKIHHAGASILGGCCGTEPAHIRALADRLRQNREQPARQDEPVRPTGLLRSREPGILDENRAAAKKSILIELDPPANDRIS